MLSNKRLKEIAGHTVESLYDRTSAWREDVSELLACRDDLLEEVARLKAEVAARDGLIRDLKLDLERRGG